MTTAFINFAFVLGWLMATISAANLKAQDKYFECSVFDLQWVDQSLPTFSPPHSLGRFRPEPIERYPYAVVPGAEVYVNMSRSEDGRYQSNRIALRTNGREVLEGTLYWPSDGTKMIQRKFRLDPSNTGSVDRELFLREKLKYFRRLYETDAPGTAWFRHQIRQTREALGEPPVSSNPNRQFFGNRGNSVADTFALLSGGRALSEGLALDELMATVNKEAPTVPLDSIRGIEIPEYEWSGLTQHLAVVHDALAHWIPDDQYMLLVPGTDQLKELGRVAAEQGIPVLNLAEPRAQDALIRAKYERQLGLSLDRIADSQDSIGIQRIVLTGSDVYFRTGTDLAVFFEVKDSRAFAEWIETEINEAADQFEEYQRDDGVMGDIRYQGVRTKSRDLSSYRAVIGDAVVVTNSLAQLKRLVETYHGQRAALSSLPAYRFLRDRYPAIETETGFLIIPDKAIRRWCSPRWRIASSRRTRAAAVMAEIQSMYLDQILARNPPQDLASSDLTEWMGEVKLESHGLSSKEYGTLWFQTPIAEMDLETVTDREAETYKQWANDYRRTWSSVLDTIAVQFQISEGYLEADVSVVPLATRSEYRTILAFSKGGHVGANAGDPHPGTLIHAVLALNRDSRVSQRYAGLLRILTGEIKVNPLSWIGDTISIYVDDQEFFTELARVSPEDLDRFLESDIHRLPVAVHIDVRDTVNLARFLPGVRKFVENAAPDMTNWEWLEYEGHPYLRIAPTELAQSRGTSSLFNKLTFYYATDGDSLILTLNESLLEQYFDRSEVRRRQGDAESGHDRQTEPWLGEHFNLQINGALLSYIDRPLHEYYQRSMQNLSWKNIPILNEWKTHYPDRDPLAVHEAFSHRRLVCPGGGRYRWNPAWQTMESTVYGHPGEPKDGPTWTASLSRLAHGNFGLTIEDHGLRARIKVRRK